MSEGTIKREITVQKIKVKNRLKIHIFSNLHFIIVLLMSVYTEKYELSFDYLL